MRWPFFDRRKNTDWRVYVAPLFAKRLIDGTRASGPLMRRRVDGVWQYRRMTEDEERDYMSRDAW